MAKRKKSKKKKSQRKTGRFTRLDKVLRPEVLRLNDIFKDQQREPLIDDLRTWHPEGKYRQPKTIYGTKATTRISDFPKRTGLQNKIQFERPFSVVTCRRRKERRETLFKLGKIGKGKKGSGRKRRMTIRSKIKC